MRSPLGRIATLTVAAATLIVASASGVSADESGSTATTSTTSTTTAPTTTTSSSSSSSITTTTTTSSSSTTSTTSTTQPAPLVVALPSATPDRGTQAQVTDTLPPPPTTTTTTTLPPSWVLPVNSGTGRRVVYSKSHMRVWTVEADGSVSKTHLVSGRRTWNQPTPGTYSVFSRSQYTCNITNPYICWRYMVRFTKGPEGDNIGFHEIPTDTRTGYKLQSLSQLGQALSGGCVRQAPDDAAFMWSWAPVGTRVVVLG